MKPHVEIVTTADGSPTLYSADAGEHYHSIKGALTESRHVFIEMGLRRVMETHNGPIRVFEVGYGTGLNAALTVAEAETEHPINYIGVELYPLDPLVVEEAGYAEAVPQIREVNAAPWGAPIDFGGGAIIAKYEADFHTFDLPRDIDVVYFDAFSPETHPQMWERSVWKRLYEAMRSGGVLTTYCAKGSVRRMLADVGFIVERLPGPPKGKREILRATKP